MKQLVRIVIPVRNLWAYSEACLRSLRKSAPGEYYQVAVSDDASSDETARACPALGQELFPGRFSYLRGESNLGFAGACNAGALGADTQFLLFLNNDTILREGWLAALLKSAQCLPRLGALSPLLVFPADQRVQHAGVAFAPQLNPVHIFQLYPAGHPLVSGLASYQALSASCLLVPRQAFEACGGFYPGYQNGGEDLELSCRLRRQGLKLYLEPQSRIEHHTSLTPGRYAHLAHNSRLVNQRCQGCFKEDWQQLLERAGLELGLNAWLAPLARLGQARLAELESQSLPEDPARLEQALLDEPLWEQGNLRLVRLLARQGESGAAFTYARLLAHFHPSLEHYALARDLARAAGLGKEAELFEARRVEAGLLCADLAALKIKASSLSELYAGLKQPKLENLYRYWLRLHP